MVESAENTYIAIENHNDETRGIPKGYLQKMENQSTRQSLLKLQNNTNNMNSQITAVSQVNNDPRMNYQMKIQSSKAFSNNDHEQLRDILQKLEKSAVAKKMAEIEASKNGIQKKIKSRDVSVKKNHENDKKEKLRKFLEKEKLMQTDRLIFQAMKIPHKQDQGIALKKFSMAQVGSPFDNRSKSTIKPSSNSKFDMKMSKQKNHDRKASKLSSVNSYKYLQNQWPEINVNSYTKREFVRSLAKEQIHNPALKDRLQEIQGYHGETRSIYDKSYYGGENIDSARSEYANINGGKAKKSLNVSPIHAKIIRGIDKNRELMYTI